MNEWFWDEAAGAFFDTARDAEPLITRPREVTDNAVPSGTSLAVELLLRVAEVDDRRDYRRRAAWVLDTLAEPMARYGPAFGHLLGAAELSLFGAVEVAIAGDPGAADTRALLEEVAQRYLPNLVLVVGMPGGEPAAALLRDRPMVAGKATGYVCRQFACDTPATAPEAFGKQLEAAVGGPPQGL